MLLPGYELLQPGPCLASITVFYSDEKAEIFETQLLHLEGSFPLHQGNSLLQESPILPVVSRVLKNSLGPVVNASTLGHILSRASAHALNCE